MDVGIVNTLLERGALTPGSELFGKAFENWVFHELSAYNAYRQRRAKLAYWRLSTGVEVDFIVNQMVVAIEAKASERIRSHHLKNLRELKADHPQVGRRIIISLCPDHRISQDGIEMVDAQRFCKMLWAGEIF